MIATHFKRSCALNIRSSHLMAALSLSTMTILTVAAIVIVTVIAVMPVVILALGEQNEGQRDLILQPHSQYMNSTKVKIATAAQPMPRFKAKVKLNGVNADAKLIDFKLEREQHLGNIGGNEPQDHRFIYPSSKFGLIVYSEIEVQFMDREIFDVIRIAIVEGRVDVPNRMKIIKQLDELKRKPILKANFIVKENLQTQHGKEGVGKGEDFVFMDIRYALQQIIRQTYVSEGIMMEYSALIQYINSGGFKLEEYASEVTINIPNRIEFYSNSDYEASAHKLVQFGEQILSKIGMFSVKSSMPIADSFSKLGYVAMFLGVMLKTIIITLFVLSVIMMNNMLLMDVERKNFDFAVLKVMGSNKTFIIVNILMGSLKFVAFANILAYPIAYFALYFITQLFEDFFGFRYELAPTEESIIGGIIIGVFVPIFAAISPIWGVIHNDLVDSLNPIRNKTEATKSEIYIEGREFPISKFVFGFLSTSYGLMIYYLLPKSFINQNVGMLLSLFFIFIGGLLAGLILLSYSFQYIFEKYIVKLFLFWIDPIDSTLLLKNLSAHRQKNRRSSIVYALSVAFIIFVSSGVQIQMQTLYNERLKAMGSSHIEIRAKHIDREYYNRVLSEIEGIQDWSFMTWELESYYNYIGQNARILVSDKAKLYFAKNQIQGVSPNFISSFYYNKIASYKTDAVLPYDPYSYLYSEKGYMTGTISLYIAKKFGFLNSNFRQFYLNIYFKDKLIRVPLNYSSIFDKRVGLFYSAIIPYGFVGVSFDTYREIGGFSSNDDIPIRYVKLRLQNESQVKVISEQIRQQINMSNVDWVMNQAEFKESIDKISNTMANIFLILLVVVLVISFFSLITTTYVNVINQTNEIAILMVLGLQKMRIAKVYIYESFAVVANSCIIGIAVGCGVAYISMLQIGIFSDQPVSIQINGLFIIVLVVIISSLLSTYKPLCEIFSHSISEIMNFSN